MYVWGAVIGCVLFYNLIHPQVAVGQDGQSSSSAFSLAVCHTLLISLLLLKVGPFPVFHSCACAEGSICVLISLFWGDKFLEVDFLGQHVYEC